MIRKSRMRLEGTRADPEPYANSRTGSAPGVLNSERSIVYDSPLPMIELTGPDHLVRHANIAFCQLCSKTEDQLTGKRFEEIAHWKGCLALLNQAYSTGKIAIQTEPEGKGVHLSGWSYTVWPIRGTEDQAGGVIVQLAETTQFRQRTVAVNEQLLLSGVREHDLRKTAERLTAQLQLESVDRKRMELALVNSEKLAVTARFALTIAHEINNPLAAITNLVYLLGTIDTGPEAQAYIATIEDQLKGLSRISTQMLKFHRDGNKPAVFDLNPVLREISDFYRVEAEKQGIVIDQRLEADATILAFKSEIVQVVTNLLLNALDATPARGQVIIHLYPAPRWLCEIHESSGYCLSIADSGSGIAPEDRARIYQPFFTTKGERGTGLGLWVSVGIIDRIGGSIRVWSSCRRGRSGTCFSIFLPAKQIAYLPLSRRRG